MGSKNKWLYNTAFLLILILICACQRNDDFEKPNIIFIMADDLGYGGLGSYGAKLIQTPNCDRLAREGIMFTDAHSPSSVCSPTRYGVLTGEYAWRSWLRNWVLMEHMPLLIDTFQMTVQKFLHKQGYVTGCVGKWHLGWGNKINPNWNARLYPGPIETGFDYFFGVPYSHNSSPELQVFVEDDRIVGLNRGDSLQDKDVLANVQRSLENTATALSEKAVQFIEANKDRPFFLYYPATNVHLPHTPHKRFQGKSNAGVYGDFVTEFDWAVGEILQTLDENGLTDNTLVIVTSDNGAKHQWDANGHKPNGDWRGWKATIYEAGHRVPFIARWPGKIKAGTKSDRTICLTDLLASCADILNVELKQHEGKDSKSILPLLLGYEINAPIREHTVHHSISGMFAIRAGDWKYIDGVGQGFNPSDFKATAQSGLNKPTWNVNSREFEPFYYYWPAPKKKPGSPQGQLYNLKTDPKEENNLYHEQPQKVKDMKRLLKSIKNL